MTETECNTQIKGERKIMETNEISNTAIVAGTVKSTPVISHQIEGENFLDFEVEVERLSKTVDIIPVTVSERTENADGIKIGDSVVMHGQYRSHNKNINDKNRLILHFFAKDIETAKEHEQLNEVKLVGYICKTPVYRKTPFEREICDVLLAVNRTTSYHKSDYIPCIFWGRNARFVSNLPVGTKLEVSGRIQSRNYIKTQDDGHVEEKTAYEVSCQNVAILENAFKKINEEKII